MIIRHGKAEGYSDRDFERKLVKKGEADSLVMGRYLVSQGIFPQMFISSHAPRARQTAENILSVYKEAKKQLTFTLDEALYPGDMNDYVNAIRNLPDDVESAALVGHNPCLEDAISYMCADVDYFVFRKTSVFLMKFQSDSWKDISENSCRFVMSSTVDNARDFYTSHSVKDMFKRKKEKFCKLFSQVQANPCKKNIHKLRVDARWWKENVKTVKAIEGFEKPKVKKIGKILRITGKTRDLQNQYKWLKNNCNKDKIKEIWKKELDMNFKKTIADISVLDLKDIMNEMEKNTRSMESLCTNLYTNGQLDYMLKNKITGIEEKIGNFENLSDIHEFRLHIKKIRYLAEFKEEIDDYFDIYGGQEEKKAGILKSISADIGEITDLTAFINTVDYFGEKKRCKKYIQKISELRGILEEKRKGLIVELKSKILAKAGILLPKEVN